MQFGRVDFHELDALDWSLTDDHPQTQKVLSGKPEDRFEIRLGCTGWSNKAWKGQIYPVDAKDKDFLKHYARIYSSVELNSSHYRLPPDDWITRWREQVPEGFKFCPKLHQQISHRGSLGSSASMTGQFIQFLEKLRPHLGLSFIQLPERYGPEQVEDLRAFLDQWPEDFPLSIEFRHPDWFRPGRASEEIWDLMQENKISTVITDTAGRPDVRHMRLTTAEVMIRFVGNHPHKSDSTRLESWSTRIRQWKMTGLRRIYLFLHQHDNIGVDLSTRSFAEQWNAHNKERLGFPGEQPPLGQMGLF